MSICIETVKIINLAYLATLYTSIGTIFSLFYSKFISKILPQNNEIVNTFKNSNNLSELLKNNKNIVNELVLYTIIDSVTVFLGAYFLRQIVKHIPFPLHNLCGFDKNRVKEQHGSILLSVLTLSYFTFKEKLVIYNDIWKYDKSLLIKPTSFIIIFIIFINLFKFF